MKIYIVTGSGRGGTEFFGPIVFKTREQAEKFADDCITDYAREFYYEDICDLYEDETDADNYSVSRSVIEKWADENGIVFDGLYFSDGSDEYAELKVTEVEI